MMAGFRIRQNGMIVARTSSPDRQRAEREILNYAMQYRQDAPLTIQRQTRSGGLNPEGKWRWVRHIHMEQWPPSDGSGEE